MIAGECLQRLAHWPFYKNFLSFGSISRIGITGKLKEAMFPSWLDVITESIDCLFQKATCSDPWPLSVKPEACLLPRLGDGWLSPPACRTLQQVSVAEQGMSTIEASAAVL